MGVALGKAAEGSELIFIEHDPAVGHGAADRNIELLSGQDCGGAFHAADEAGSGPVDRGIVAVGPAGAEVRHGPVPRRLDDPAGLGGNEALVVELGQDLGLDDLGLHDIRHHGDDGLARIDDAALGEGVHVPVEAEVLQIAEEALVKLLEGAEVVHVLLLKMQGVQIVHDLLQPRKDGEAALIRVPAEEHIESHPGVPTLLVQIVAVGHGKLIEVHDHGRIGRHLVHFSLLLR